MNRRQCLTMLPMAGLALMSGVARARGYPSKPITLIVGGAPGSVPDVMVRPVAERLSVSLGQPVIVQNRPGAAGSLAMTAVVRSTPDGYTLGLATMSQAVFNSYLFAKLPYDPQRDLEPVAPLVTGAMAIAAHPAFAAGTLPELIALAKTRQLFMAMPQAGSPPHIVALLLNRATGIELTMVPHTSGTDALRATMAGDIPLLIDAPTIIWPQAQAGKLKVLTVTGAQREPMLPEIPTASESGHNVQGEAWIGLVAPAGTPAVIVRRVNNDLANILATDEMRGLMAKLSFRPLRSTPEEFRDLIRTEHTKWSVLIREAGLRFD